MPFPNRKGPPFVLGQNSLVNSQLHIALRELQPQATVAHFLPIRLRLVFARQPRPTFAFSSSCGHIRDSSTRPTNDSPVIRQLSVIRTLPILSVF